MQKYFVKPTDRKGSCYYEFYKGEWDENTFWKDDSICINDDDIYDSELDNIIIGFVPNYDPFGETVVTFRQWEQIKNAAISAGGKAAEIVQEAEEWMVDTFSKHNIFTILGL